MADGATFKLSVQEPNGRIAVGNTAAVRAMAHAFEKASKDRRQCARRTTQKYMLLIQGEARKNLKRDPTRVRTGHLRQSIQTEISAMMSAQLRAIVYSDLPYAEFVHYGTGIFGQNPKGGHRMTPWVYYDEKYRRFVFTRGMRPNRFLLDAYNTHAKNYLRDMKQCLSGQS